MTHIGKIIENLSIPKVPTLALHNSYAQSVAASLIAYANQNKFFASELRAELQNIPDILASESNHYITRDIEIMVPHRYDNARKKMYWLFARIKENALPNSAIAIHLLKSWASGNPKAIVIGVVGFAVPGVTLGLIKRKSSKMIIVVSNYYSNDAISFSIIVSKLVMGVFSENLKSAGGDLPKLEPEVGEWYFGNQDIILYETEGKKLEMIERQLTATGIIHKVYRTNNISKIIAISPILDYEIQESYWSLSGHKS